MCLLFSRGGRAGGERERERERDNEKVGVLVVRFSSSLSGTAEKKKEKREQILQSFVIGLRLMNMGAAV